MVFDKTKAMRNAERYLAQGKIQNAIGEYKQVVANDPKDFGTLNMLGDLHTKNSDSRQAIVCYTAVAEHYSKQGFAQKAIAIYNKISKLQPGSIDITEKLAELYRQKGSVNEARMHYKTVAEHHERAGRKLDALATRKQIASLDPNDTSIYLHLAEAYLEEDQSQDAAEAYTEAGLRFAKKSEHGQAVEAFRKALDINPGVPKLLPAYVQSHIALGSAALVVETLIEVHSASPHDHDLLHLLIDCHLEAGNTAEAEKCVIGLVEKEPASYSKLLDLARIYLKLRDGESAARVMAMSSEHLLLAGQVDDFETLLADLTEIDPEHLECLRLRARLSAWQRDEAAMHDALTMLAVAAREQESVEDERYALSQLVMIAPQQVEYADRLRELNEKHGFEDAYSYDSLFDVQFMRASEAGGSKDPEPEPEPEPELETFAIVSTDKLPVVELIADSTTDGSYDFAIVGGDDTVIEAATLDTLSTVGVKDRLLREIDSIRFYIDSGYLELASKAIGELRVEFGNRAEVDELVSYLENKKTEATESETITETQTASAVADAKANGNGLQPKGFGIADLRTELGIEEVDVVDDSDYDTHYHTAVAYQEMGLLDEAIREFQEAVGLVQPNDPTRRFFQCSNLLGHCFMQKSMPNLALTWFQRALETPGLSDDEKQGIWYELAAAYEADGDLENAGRYFEQVYAENIDFRDVSERVRNMALS